MKLFRIKPGIRGLNSSPMEEIVQKPFEKHHGIGAF